MRREGGVRQGGGTGSRAGKEKKAAEMALAEAKGRLEAEKERLLKEVRAASEASQAAQAEVLRVESELRDYKVPCLLPPRPCSLACISARGGEKVGILLFFWMKGYDFSPKYGPKG